MDRRKLKCGGKKPRRKALFGTDGAVMAAATLAAAGINAGATALAAKEQAKAVTENAKTQAQSIKDQTINNNNLQRESINFTRQQNQENRQQQQDIQTTLQMLAGQENLNDRMEANKIQVRLGGRPKVSLKGSSSFSYGGANMPFTVTDGGGVIPIAITPNGYGLYELYGNDHEHYHKTKGGKNKTGVGIKFNDGSIVEGEGNQNTNQGELLYVTPNDAMFISKHSIEGFNPAKAVLQGANPEQVFAVQEVLKDAKGLNDDGSKENKRSMKYTYGGANYNINQANMTQYPSNITAPIAGGVIYALNNTMTPPVEGKRYDAPIAKRGCRVSLKNGGTSQNAYNTIDKFLLNLNNAGKTAGKVLGTGSSSYNNINNNNSRGSFWDNYGGATANAAGNILGAGLTTWGNMYAGKKLGEAYSQAGNILADAYSQMRGVDMNEISREDFNAPHTLSVVRSANTNINPQLERLRRNADYERTEVNRGTLSSAARQQRLAAINDRMYQRMGEQYAYKDNTDEQIKQTNAARITETAAANADRDVQANKDYTTQRLSLLQYNNNIENAKIAGMAQAKADALTQAQTVNSQAFQNSMGAIGSSLAASGQGFASAFDTARKLRTEAAYSLVGMPDIDQINYVISNKDADGARSIYNRKLSQLAQGNLSPETVKSLNADLSRLRISFPNINF